MADRGAWKSAKDMARFLRFNLFETTFMMCCAPYAKPSDTLKDLRVDDLPPCYSAVLIAAGLQRVGARTVYWKEGENEPGVIIATKDAKCQVAPPGAVSRTPVFQGKKFPGGNLS